MREVLTGEHFMLGDFACAEGAVAAGCRFFAGYPITPSTEIAERLALRLPEVGGTYIQMEDELGSIAAVIGASCGGMRAMTATSGPGYSLMMEHVGLAIMMEVPCVIVNVMRGGPSTGLPTTVGQQDVMQARWGSHGDYELIAYTPWSVQEAFDLTVKAFNMADRYRVPVMMMIDETIGHMTERLTIPEKDQIEIVPRKRPATPAGNGFLPFKADEDDLVPPFLLPGEGYFFHFESLTHDERGYPQTTAPYQEKLVSRLLNKIRKNAGNIIEYEEMWTEDADIVVVSYGVSARCALSGVRKARREGIRTGFLRLKTLWPFPEQKVYELGQRVKGFVVAEINAGQMIREVERCAHADVPFVLVNKLGGAIMTPDEVAEGIERAMGREARGRVTA
ncbi:MAG: 2-oxoacid:acceptor oxidoreductase subunit alpha [bacterium JZ-2024 1]